jgi:predicted DCC family thiol-disulfide oxidoreductase YuxK
MRTPGRGSRRLAAPTAGVAPPPRPDVVLYDGVCGLCNGLVRFVLPRDRAGRFRFAALQGPAAHAILTRHGRDAAALDTVYVAVPDARGGERLLSKSRAVLHLLRGLGAPWSAAVLASPLPTRLLDAGYDLVARYRYRIFGRSEACLLPRPEWRDRFIDAGG